MPPPPDLPTLPCRSIRGTIGTKWRWTANRYGPFTQAVTWPPEWPFTGCLYDQPPMPTLRALWRSMTKYQRNRWNNRARHRHMTPENAFHAENLRRFRDGLPFTTVPT